jgi:hypothetical protein
VAYVHMRRSTLLVWYSRATFGTAPLTFQSVVAPSSMVQTV